MTDLLPLPPARPGRCRQDEGGGWALVDVVRHGGTLAPPMPYRAPCGDGT